MLPAQKPQLRPLSVPLWVSPRVVSASSVIFLDVMAGSDFVVALAACL